MCIDSSSPDLEAKEMQGSSPRPVFVDSDMIDCQDVANGTTSGDDASHQHRTENMSDYVTSGIQSLKNDVQLGNSYMCISYTHSLFYLYIFNHRLSERRINYN